MKQKFVMIKIAQLNQLGSKQGKKTQDTTQ